MKTIEFEADAQRDIIKIPEEHNDLYSKHLRILIMVEDSEKPKSIKEKGSLLDVCGTWSDKRSTDEIIHDIYSKRTSSDSGASL